MSFGTLCWLIGGLILLALGFDLINNDKANWVYVAAAFAFFGVALSGFPVPDVLPSRKAPQ